MNKKCIIKYELFARLIKFAAIIIIWLDSPSGWIITKKAKKNLFKIYLTFQNIQNINNKDKVK